MTAVETPTNVPPTSAELAPAIEPGESRLSIGVGHVNAIRELFEEEGLELSFAGGSLPLIDFDRAGQCLMCCMKEVFQPEGHDFELITLDVLDPQRYKQTKDAKQSLMSEAQIVRSFALHDFSDFEAHPENRGAVVLLTYGGKTSTRRGQSPMKLITIHRLGAKGEPVPEATPARAPAKKKKKATRKK